MNILEAIVVIVSLVILYRMTRGRNQSTPKLPYNDSRFKSSSECRFWGHDWTGWRVVRGGDTPGLQKRECVECGRVQQRIDPYMKAQP